MSAGCDHPYHSDVTEGDPYFLEGPLGFLVGGYECPGCGEQTVQHEGHEPLACPECGARFERSSLICLPCEARITGYDVDELRAAYRAVARGET